MTTADEIYVLLNKDGQLASRLAHTSEQGATEEMGGYPPTTQVGMYPQVLHLVQDGD